MDQLPSAIQKEIWEYVRGHRAYWKSKYEQVLHLLGAVISVVERLGGDKTIVSRCILVEVELVKLVPDVLEVAIERGKESREQRNWLRAHDRAIYPSTKSELAENDLAYWCANPSLM